MIGHRQQRILAVLAGHPAGLVAENLLAAVCPSNSPPRERQRMLRAVHALAAAGQVSIVGKKNRTEVAGALVSRIAR
jgi:hypothetical protein